VSDRGVDKRCFPEVSHDSATFAKRLVERHLKLRRADHVVIAGQFKDINGRR
jgi:hypothetical protein